VGLFPKKRKLNIGIHLATYTLTSQLKRLEEITDRLQRQDKEIFNKCVEARASGNETYAKLYATECSQIRKILRAVNRAKLALEQGIIRLRTAMNLNSLFTEMAKVSNIIKNTHVKITEAPLIAAGVGNVSEILAHVVPESYEVEAVLPVEAKNVLQEAQLVAERAISEKFPKPVPEPTMPESPVDVMQSGGSPEQDVRDYMRALGEVDPLRCSIDLGYPKELVERIIEKLKEEA
jgi:division protein CdvB (Snf7/Vps24/ESCRT-III family)